MISLSLSRTAEYALRAMSQLALIPGTSPMRALELSRETGVPLPYLLKIMRQLVTAGLVLSAKGHGGGFRVAKPLGKISYLDILQVVGYGSEPDQCVFGWGECRSDHPCPMHDSWSIANKGFIAWAKSTTLAELRQQTQSRSGKSGPRP